MWVTVSFIWLGGALLGEVLSSPIYSNMDLMDRSPLHTATSSAQINLLVKRGYDINARDYRGRTPLHNMVENNWLSCVLALLSLDAELNLGDNEGNLPLHLVKSGVVLQALLVFGAQTTVKNNKGLLVRHVVASSSYEEKNMMLNFLHVVGAPRCEQRFADCTEGCSPKGDYNGTIEESNHCSPSRYEEFFDSGMLQKTISGMQEEAISGFPGLGKPNKKSGRILSLDGGGMKGIVLTQLLLAIEEAAGQPVHKLFDWFGGTSTGGIMALALAMGKGVHYTRGLFFRMKDLLFVGPRPYDEKILEGLLKEEFGEDSVMSQIIGPKVIVTSVLVDRYPGDLHLFRNYQSGENLLEVPQDTTFAPTNSPNNQLIWQAARAAWAAPPYFRPFERFIDGGLISNNPTLDIWSEIYKLNSALKSLGRAEETTWPAVLISLGTGISPVCKVTMAYSIEVKTARLACYGFGTAYLRLSPQLSLVVDQDETRDDILVKALWETTVYIKSKASEIQQFADLLTAHGSP